MGLLEGKKIVVTGVLTDASLAYGVARIALEEGAEIVLTGAGRALSLTRRTARKLTDLAGGEIAVYELDVTVPEHAAAVRDDALGHVGPRRRRAALHRVRSRRRASATTSWPPPGTTWPSPSTSRRTR